MHNILELQQIKKNFNLAVTMTIEQNTDKGLIFSIDFLICEQIMLLIFAPKKFLVFCISDLTLCQHIEYCEHIYTGFVFILIQM